VNNHAKGDALFVAYVGPSMNPTLREPEMVEILPYGSRPIQVGDVIFFTSPEADRPVVHRIVSVTATGIRTRGDNNPQEDNFVLQPGDIEGQVVAAWRGQKRREIVGGWRGRLASRWLRWRHIIDRKVSPLLHSVYHAMARQGIFIRLLPARFRPRVVAFQTSSQDRLQLLMGRHVIGRYDGRLKQWQIQRPFRLFVNEKVLLKTQNRH